jgi:signal peptidase II
MKNFQKKYIIFFLFAAAFIITADQLTKGFAVSHLKDAIQITCFLSFTLSFNKGISFGMFNDPNSQQIVFVVISICIIAYLVFMMKFNTRSIISTSLIVGGAIGNVIDRVKLGAVVDFIHLHYQSYHFPIFNVADMAICIGCFLLIICEHLESHKSKMQSKNA